MTINVYGYISMFLHHFKTGNIFYDCVFVPAQFPGHRNPFKEFLLIKEQFKDQIQFL